jgi:serine/threonine protein kinase/tetratricopeptide (TPR) repeat protein
LDSERFARLREIVLRVRDAAPETRVPLLDELCAGDEGLRREAEELLARDRKEDSGLLRTAAPLVGADEDAFARGSEGSGLPERIGPYHLREELGRGGMGVVVRAEQYEPLRREVALKLIKRGMDTDAVISRFMAERQALARMQHPNIARVLDAGATEDGRPYFVMEYVPGAPITRFCDEETLDSRQRIELFLEVCRAVQHAHQRGVLHRDLKPSNILAYRGDDGIRVKVIDFGIAKAFEDPIDGATAMTRAGQLLGTPDYMSPEQAGITGAEVDTRSDVYSLGAVLYVLLSGRRPYSFERYTLEEVQKTFREKGLLRPSTALSTPSTASTDEEGTTESAADIGARRGCSASQLRRQLEGDLDNIVLMAMHKEPDRRYASVDALADDIRRYRTGQTVRARPDRLGYRLGKFLRRNRAVVGLATAAVLALVTFAISTSVQSRRIAKQRDRAVAAEQKAHLEAQTAKQVSDFLVGLFEVSDPDESKGEQITAREILDAGAKRLDTELESQPLVRARLKHTIGAVYQNLGLYAEADSQLAQSLALRRKELGDRSAEVAESLVQRAWLLRDEGKSEEALPYLQKALGIQREIYGEEDPVIDTTLYQLASTWEDLGDLERAIPLFRQVLVLDRRLLDPDDPQIGESMNNLAVALDSYGSYAEAESLYRESLADYRRVLGPVHPEVATTLANLSNLLFNTGKREEGIEMGEKALAMRRKIFGDEHPHTAIAAGNLGIKYYVMKRYPEAERLLHESLEVKQRTQGERHPSTAHAWLLLGLCELGQEHWAKAEHCFSTSRDIFEEVYPEGHNSVARALDGLGRAYMGEGRDREAEPILRKALALRERFLPEGHRERCDSLLHYGEALMRLGRMDEAETHLTEGYEALKKSFGPDSDRTRKAASILAEFYDEKGDAAQAATYRAAAQKPDASQS